MCQHLRSREIPLRPVGAGSSRAAVQCSFSRWWWRQYRGRVGEPGRPGVEWSMSQSRRQRRRVRRSRGSGRLPVAGPRLRLTGHHRFVCGVGSGRELAHGVGGQESVAGCAELAPQLVGWWVRAPTASAQPCCRVRGLLEQTMSARASMRGWKPMVCSVRTRAAVTEIPAPAGDVERAGNLGSGGGQVAAAASALVIQARLPRPGRRLRESIRRRPGQRRP